MSRRAHDFGLRHRWISPVYEAAVKGHEAREHSNSMQSIEVVAPTTAPPDDSNARGRTPQSDRAASGRIQH